VSGVRRIKRTAKNAQSVDEVHGTQLS
jgi:hypothetical protein